MKHNSFFYILFVLFLNCGLPAEAVVSWTERELKLQAEPGAEKISGVFTFTNQGEQDVTITSVRPSCGCTVAKLGKSQYAPGESGSIEATFKFGDRVGHQTKKIVVRTDDPESPVTTLTLRVDVPKLIEVSPRLLRWDADEGREAKTVDVKLHKARPVVISAVESDRAGIEFQIEEIEVGRHYRITVRPTGLNANIRAVVTLLAESEPPSTPAEAIEGGEGSPATAPATPSTPNADKPKTMKIPGATFLVRVTAPTPPEGASPQDAPAPAAAPDEPAQPTAKE